MENNVNLWNKKTDELTVGDAVKINAGILAALVAIPVVVGGAVAGVERIGDWNRRRKMQKAKNFLADQ